MTGKVVSIAVKPGDSVQKGDVVVVLESMKMETSLVAARAGIVEEVMVQEQQIVDARQPLVALKEEKSS